HDAAPFQGGDLRLGVAELRQHLRSMFGEFRRRTTGATLGAAEFYRRADAAIPVRLGQHGAVDIPLPVIGEARVVRQLRPSDQLAELAELAVVAAGDEDLTGSG